MKLHYKVDGGAFTSAGFAAGQVKRTLRQLGISPEIIRKISIAMYEAEMNMVLHANGGNVDVELAKDYITVVLEDQGPGIEDIDRAMEVGYSTASQKVRSMGFGAGMGLPNMKRYADELTIDTKLGVGTRVELKVFI